MSADDPSEAKSAELDLVRPCFVVSSVEYCANPRLNAAADLGDNLEYSAWDMADRMSAVTAVGARLES